MRFDRAERSALIAVITLIAMSVVIGLRSQTPPLPPGSTINVTVAWDPPPASDVYHAVDTNGNLDPLTYRVWHASSLSSTNSITNFTVVSVTTNYQSLVTNLDVFTPHFFLVTVSNYFLESDPSSLLGLPALKGRIKGLRLVTP